MFIGRERELRQLTQYYQTNSLQLAVLYGRRRVGKTSLIQEFCKGKEALYFSAMETNALQNLACLNHVLSAQLKGRQDQPPFPSFETALEYIFELSCSEHFILILDNYPCLAKTAKHISAAISDLMKKYEGHSRLFLLICGTSNTVMDQQLFLQKSPLYGKPALTILLKPFDFFECRKFFRNFSAIDMAYIYGIVGGIPQYLLAMNERLSVEDNIKATFFNPSSRIYEEPSVILRQEVREPALYNAILSAIANGASKLSEISSVIDEETSVGAAYLKTLLSMGIVRKETPLTDPSVKKTIYRIDDPLFRFWFRFLPQHLSEINRGQAASAYHQIEPQMQEYMGDVFEDICRQYLQNLSLAGKLPSPVTDIGCWWGTDPFSREKLKVDILAVSEEKEIAYFGSCFWTNQKTDEKHLRNLIEQSNFFPQKKKYYYLFAKNGFTRDCYDLANQLETVTLVSFSK
ncbi:MAG: ATP-binding protein [Blautia sp.]|nr:ATP-binding protein [Blautia sp.]